MTSATIIRHNDQLSIGWAFGSCGDNTGCYPATEQGLAELKADLINDNWSAGEDIVSIAMMELPLEDGKGDSVALHGGE